MRGERHLPLYTRREGCCSRLLLDRGLKGLGLSLDAFKKVIVLDDLHLLIQAVLAGNGASFLPTDLVREHLDSGVIREHRIEGFEHTRPRTFVVNGTLHPGTPLAQFAKAVLAHFKLPLPAGPLNRVGSTGTPQFIDADIDLAACPGCLPPPPVARPRRSSR